MLNKLNFLLLLVVGSGLMTNVSGSEVSTLFTTPQERQLINTNRYKSDEVKPQVQPSDSATTESIQQLVQEEVSEIITISGITLSNSGPNMVWINSQVYEDGDKMDDKMRIKVIPGNQAKVRITAPDGKHYYATSGETLEIVYQAAVEN